DVGVGSPVGHAPPQPLHGTHAKTLEPHAAAPDLRREEHDRAKHARVDRYLAVEAEPIAVEDPRTHDGLEQVLAERRPAERRETREDASPSLVLEQEQDSRSIADGEKGPREEPSELDENPERLHGDTEHAREKNFLWNQIGQQPEAEAEVEHSAKDGQV